jgi:hypothetical protein
MAPRVRTHVLAFVLALGICLDVAACAPAAREMATIPKAVYGKVEPEARVAIAKAKLAPT